MSTEERLTALETKMDNIRDNDLHHIKLKLEDIDKRLWITLLTMSALALVAGANAVIQVIGLVK